jgi:hypothetical protein
MLPVLLPRAGFGEVGLRTWQELSAEVEHMRAALRLDAALEEAVGDGSLAPDTARAWRTEVDAALQRGELQLVLRFFQYTASAIGAPRQLTSGRE